LQKLNVSYKKRIRDLSEIFTYFRIAKTHSNTRPPINITMTIVAIATDINIIKNIVDIGSINIPNTIKLFFDMAT